MSLIAVSVLNITSIKKQDYKMSLFSVVFLIPTICYHVYSAIQHADSKENSCQIPTMQRAVWAICFPAFVDAANKWRLFPSNHFLIFTLYEGRQREICSGSLLL